VTAKNSGPGTKLIPLRAVPATVPDPFLNEARNRTAASAIPAAKIDRTKSESRRQRRERERIERREIEKQLEERLFKGKVTSASKLIEEILWPSSKAGRAGGLGLGRSP
jgi:hypothetical protein